MSSQVVWYAARASGIVAWALAAASVLWGLALSTRALGRKPRPAWLFDLHRFLGGTALIFTSVHVVSILLDTYVHFGIVNVLVPFTGTWHPVAVAWGIVGFYALLAVELTSLARARISKAVWRRVHFAAFALFAMTTVHALTAGTDAHSRPFVVAVIATCAAVVSLTGMRIARTLRRVGAAPRPAVVGTGSNRPETASAGRSMRAVAH
jgi:DMSO/TMAO reductase YedYZ heme-binding membrane subunit